MTKGSKIGQPMHIVVDSGKLQEAVSQLHRVSGIAVMGSRMVISGVDQKKQYIEQVVNLNNNAGSYKQVMFSFEGFMQLQRILPLLSQQYVEMRIDGSLKIKCVLDLSSTQSY